MGEKIWVGIPALLGVWLGIVVFAHGKGALILLWALPFALFAISILAHRSGRPMLAKRPGRGRALIELTVLGAVGIVALVTAVLTLLTFDFPHWIFFNPGSAHAEKLAAAGVAAVSTFAALVWTKDIGDGSGYFWASTQFRKGMKAAGETHGLAGTSRAQQACFSEAVDDLPNDLDPGPVKVIEGWGFAARGQRAAVLAHWLKRQKPPPAA